MLIKGEKLKKKISLKDLLIVAAAILLVVYGITTIILIEPLQTTLSRAEASKPASLSAVELTYSSCSDCFDVSQVVSFIERFNANVNVTTVDYSTQEGKALAANYSINKLPSLIVSGELDKNSNLTSLWGQIGTREDGVAVFRDVPPIYFDVKENKERGKVDLISIVDSSCKVCYNVSALELVLQNRILLKFDSHTTYDINSTEGKNIIAKYKIENVPTLLLSPETDVYPIKDLWSQVGTVESDGWYVFRNMKALGNVSYMNLTAGKVVSVVP